MAKGTVLIISGSFVISIILNLSVTGTFLINFHIITF